MKRYFIYGAFYLVGMGSLVLVQGLYAQSLFDSAASNISGSSGPLSGTVSNSAASGAITSGENSLNGNVTSSGVSTNANVSGLTDALSIDGDGQ